MMDVHVYDFYDAVSCFFLSLPFLVCCFLFKF